MRKLLSLTFALFITCSVYAEQTPTAKITNVSVKENNKNVTVSFNVFVPKVGADEQFILTPVLYNTEGSKSLTSITFTGNKKIITEKRSKETTGKEITNKSTTGKDIIGKEKQNIPYKVVIPYEDWMSEVSLRINSSLDACGEINILASLNILDNKLIYYDVKPMLSASIVKPQMTALQNFDKTASFLYPVSDYANRYEIFEQRRESGSLVISFQQGFWSIDPFYKNNRQTLAQVNKVLDLIDADPNATLKKIVIVGLASPEGSLEKNDILAEKRANSLKYYIGERVKYDPDLFEIINGSEDWAGLKQLVENSRMPGRWQILEILEKYSVRGGREMELMKLNSGDPYRYMAEYFFPQLRNAGYVQLYYESTPDVETVKLNSAIRLLNNRQFEQALPILLSIRVDKQLENTIGVCYMMIGDYAQAAAYFEKAIVNDNKDASDATINLEQIKIMQSIN